MNNSDNRDETIGRKNAVNRRNVLLGGTTLAAASAIVAGDSARVARAQEVLPPPEPPFKGTIGRTYNDSTPDKIPIISLMRGRSSVFGGLERSVLL
jgi:hypothetical protein